MAPTLEGGCQCGYVRYAIEGEPISLSVCHCNGCQRQSASAFGMSLAVPTSAFSLVHGELKSFVVDCDSGRKKICSFCPECGVRIHHDTRDDELSVKAGTLDDRSELRPSGHFWTAARQAWFDLPTDTTSWPDDG